MWQLSRDLGGFCNFGDYINCDRNPSKFGAYAFVFHAGILDSHLERGGGGKRQGSSCILFGSIVVACREQTRGHLNCTRDLGADYGDRVYHMYIVGVIYFM